MDSYSKSSAPIIVVAAGESVKVSSHRPAPWTSDPYTIAYTDQHSETWTFPRGGTIHTQARSFVASSTYRATSTGALRTSVQEVKFTTRVNAKGNRCRLLYFHDYPCATASKGAVQVVEEMTDTQDTYKWRLNFVTYPVGEDFPQDCDAEEPEAELSILSDHIPPGSLWQDRKASLGNMICRSNIWKRFQEQGYGEIELDLIRDELSLLFGQMIVSCRVRKRTR